LAPLQEAGGVAYLGTMGWSYRFWVGKLYPEGTKPTEYLTEYAKSMNSVEVDATFYRIPSVSTVEAWRDAVPEGFRFAAKFPQTVTHAPGLAYDAERLEVFLRHIGVLGGKLGPLLLQFPPFLKPVHTALDDLLEKLPKNRFVAAEFRNRRWFTEETYRLLRDHGVALAWTNRAEEVETAGFAYLRLEGDRKAVNGERGVVEVERGSETIEWAAKVRRYIESGRDAYGYFSKYYSGYPPADVEAMRGRLPATRPTSAGTRPSLPSP
jgi:uncharacterized protein YecE (DUF72 family)